MRAIENIIRLSVAAQAMGFTVSDVRATSNEKWVNELIHQTAKGMLLLTLSTETGPDGEPTGGYAQLDWQSDTSDDFSIIPFDIHENNEELVHVELFEVIIRNTLEFHKDQLIKD